ncbi:S41 family peptidase [Niveispirillum irakense]|uniref:S41 family peptidase n=1 Tax=Niveispirillum irakense TaxID=34011 RepID=UPI0004011C4F|nr:S41 family peptidase [Niveispirillum irakense]
MNKLFSSAAIAALLAFAPTAIVPHAAMAREPLKSETYKQLDLFADVFERVRSEYVEETSDEELISAAINGMLTSLDPHSSYLDKKSFADMRVQTRGEFGGLGIEVTQENGIVKVISPMDETPAARAGVQSGDYITHLNDESIMGLGLNEAVEKMRGPVGSDIKITIRRENVPEPINLTLTRANIKVQSVRFRVEDNVGYIRISSFNEQTQPGLDKAITSIKTQLGDKLIGYVLDLRNNPGGLLDQAVSVSDTFLDKGREIVSTRGRGGKEGDRYAAKPGDATGGLPVVVLINGGSASASEIVAGALQDHKRAIILGTQSFGKGSVQTIIPLQGNQSAMRLTTARYYTPAGKSIQQLGITPDIEVQPAKVEELAQAGRRREADLPKALRNTDPVQQQRQANPAGTPTTPPAAPGPGNNDARPQVQAPAPANGAAANAGAQANGAQPDAAPVDYQLLRAIDLLRGVSMFAPSKPTN